MGLGSQIPVTGTGTGSGVIGPEFGTDVAPPLGGGTDGEDPLCTQLLPFGQELATAPPALATIPPDPPVPTAMVPGVPPDPTLGVPPDPTLVSPLDPTLVAPPVGAVACGTH